MWSLFTKGFSFTYRLRRSLVRARKLKNSQSEYQEFKPGKALKLRFNLG